MRWSLRSSRPVRWIAIQVLVAVLSTSAWSAEPSGSRGQARPDPDQLVRLLGDPSFQVRERAAQQLATIGLRAKAALQLGTRHPDLEVRMGAHRVLLQLLRSDFEGKLLAFLNDGDETIAKELSGWERFSQVAGQQRETRELFVDMIRSELPLLDALVAKPGAEPLQPLLAERIQEYQNSRFANGMPGGVSTASLATLLFVMAQPEAGEDVSIDSRVYSLLTNSSCKQSVQQGQHSALLVALLSQWVERQSENLQSYYALRLTLTYDLDKLGVKLGRKFLTSTELSSHLIPYAAVAVARFGTREDAASLLAHLENTTVCHTWSNPQLKKEPIRIQVRDVVLALLIHLTDQQPKDYGYELLAPDPETIYRIYTFGFLEDEQREAALKKWNTWFASHRTEFPEVPALPGAAAEPAGNG